MHTPSTSAKPTARSILQGLECARPTCPCHGSAKRGRGLTHCPGHDDRSPSLSVREGDRTVLLHCFASCKSADVVAALRERGLWS